MKPMLRVLVVIVSAGIGLAAGSLWKAHRQAAALEPALTSSMADAVAQTNVAARHIASSSKKAKDGKKRDKNGAVGVEEWLRWMALLEKAAPEDYAGLARRAHGNPALWRFVVRRWARAAPRNMFDTITAQLKNGGGDLPARELANQLFSTWAGDDPAAVIAALNGPDGAAWQQYRMEVASGVLNKDVEEGLQLFHDWHIENYGPWMDPIVKWADAGPQHAAEFALAHPTGYVTQMTLDAIGAEWAKTDPEAALDFATSQSGGLATRLAAAALKQWAGTDFQAASDWLGSASAQTQGQLSSAFVQVWAQQDPQAALTWCEENLQSIPLQQAIDGVMNGATAKDVTAAAAMVTAMEPGLARTEAAGDVAQKWFPNFPSQGPVSPTIVDWMSGLDGDSVKQVLNQVTWTWAESDPAQMANFLATVNPNEIPSYTDSTVERQWVRSDPVAALNWAATLPAGQALTVGMEGFTSWQSSQADAANAWMASLPLNDPRRQAFVKK